MSGLIGQVGVAGGGENGMMAEEFLDLKQIDSGLNQMGGITVTQAVWRNLFF
nr:hypothetical protein [Acidithiobacillus thiooxidans]